MFFGGYAVDDDTQDWLVDSFDWAVDQGLLTPITPLVLPTKDFFTAKSGDPADVAAGVVRDVQGLLRAPDVRFELLELERLPAEYRHEYGKMGDVAGAYMEDRQNPVIQYDPDMASRPLMLISTMAHEVMHHILHPIAHDAPGGVEAEELNTDLHCITMGFGVIQLTAADQAGWLGYMRQATRAHALALFLHIRGLAPDAALGALPRGPRRMVRKALAQIAKSPEDADAIRNRLMDQTPAKGA